MVRAIVRSVIYTRDNPEDALQVTMNGLAWNATRPRMLTK